MRREMFVLRSAGAPKNRKKGLLVGVLLLVAIAVVNYAIFFSSSEPEALGIEERLSLPVETSEALPEPQKTSETVTEEVSLMKGEAPVRALVRVGATERSALRALEALQESVSLKGLKAGQKFVVEMTKDGEVISLTMPRDLTHLWRVEKKENGYQASLGELPTDKEVVSIACKIQDTVFSSLERCGAERELAQVVVDLLGTQIDLFSEVRRGDVLRFSVERETLGGEFLRYGKVRGLIYEGKIAEASIFPLEQDGEIKYYDGKGRSVEKPFLRTPVRFTRVSSQYSLKRLHPILHTYTPHKAIDYAAPKGTPVYALGAGKVIFKGQKGAYGKLIVLQHPFGVQTYYGHLDAFAKDLKVGDRVQKGQVIGTVGATGRATGPHLHFAVAKNGQFVNPKTLLDIAGEQLEGARFEDFLASMASMVQELKSLPVKGVEATR
jgi:murein DD-endopeptidase MepM/ murein hydrolase activator NlpD